MNIIDTQEIRRSQFILTYGPGAIIESMYGPRLVKSLIYGLGKQFSTEHLEKYEINNSRLGAVIYGIVNKYRDSKNIAGEYVNNYENIRIFSPVSGIESGSSDKNQSYYSTLEFPEWKVCYGKAPGRTPHDPVLYRTGKSKKCPVCHNNTSSIRFVMACRKGHLDDVQWDNAVHRNNSHKSCSPDYYYWKADGVSLADITISCPKCKSKVTMQDVYNTNFKCTGRYPESKIVKPCGEKMWVMQRQASSLYLPITIMLVAIPEYDNGINKLLNNRKVYFTVNPLVKNWENTGNFDQNIKNLHAYFNYNGLGDEVYAIFEDYINKYGIENLKSLLNKFSDTGKMNFMDFVYEEFNFLLSGPDNCDNFIMGEPITIKNIAGFPGLDVYPVKLIKTTTVQIGYTRKVPHDKKNEQKEDEEQDYIVSSAGSTTDGDCWYPGFEGKGEGVFIAFSAGEFPELKNRKAYNEWLNAFHGGNSGNNPPWDNSVSHPLYIWLHTLSHAIINALSLYSGYSSASMRERVYIDASQKNGGILIYTSTAGEDAGIGGLSNLVTEDKFSRILIKAKEKIDICSNDPLCMEIRKGPGSGNGAACYSCILISETSCEHRNMFLDRHIFTGD